MKISKMNFGMYNDKEVIKYTIENDKETRLSILNFAGIIQEFSIMDGEKRINLVISSNTIEGFTKNAYNFNRVIGRNAGRIGNSTWKTSDLKFVTVPSNENKNSLHGGPNGLGNNFFDVDTQENKIILTRMVTKKQDGYPGTLNIKVSYELTEDDEVIIQFEGFQTEEEGIFNPTVHTYFNLSDDKFNDISNMSLKINSDKRLELNEEKIPTGNFSWIKNTMYDFIDLTNLKDRLEILKNNTVEKGLDDAYVVKDNGNALVSLSDLTTNRQLDVYSDREGIVVYTANDLSSAVKGLNRGDGCPYMGIAIEAQGLPDAINHNLFKSTIIKKDETKKYVIKYKYHKK